jgi:two-component system, chemotaxis family, chemotaxis protein CheY
MTSGRKRILVVDDSVVVLEVLQATLLAEGYDVVIARDLGELEVRRASVRPDLVILDVQMPEAYGDELGEALREVRSEQAPMLLFSGLDDADLARRVRDAGLAGWVSKREGLGALVARVHSLLGAEAR